MKQFFEEYGGIILVVLVLAALIVIVGTDADSGLLGQINTSISGWIDSFFGFIAGALPGGA